MDIEGDVSTELSPWVLASMGQPLLIPLFRLEKEIYFLSDIAGGSIVVPKGFLSDLASIPQFAWSIFMQPDDARIELGAWVHDLLYKQQGQIVLEDGKNVTLTRKQADTILAYEAMPDLFATPLQCAAVYQAVRRFAGRWPLDSWWERFS